MLWRVSSKNSACSAGYAGSIPGLGRSPGGGNGNTRQYSCLANPTDRGAQQATVPGVTQIQTQLKPPPVVALQCHLSFDCTAKWINYTHTSIPSFWDFLPLQVTTEHGVEIHVPYRRFSLVIHFIIRLNYTVKSVGKQWFFFLEDWSCVGLIYPNVLQRGCAVTSRQSTTHYFVLPHKGFLENEVELWLVLEGSVIFICCQQVLESEERQGYYILCPTRLPCDKWPPHSHGRLNQSVSGKRYWQAPIALKQSER